MHILPSQEYNITRSVKDIGTIIFKIKIAINIRDRPIHLNSRSGSWGGGGKNFGLAGVRRFDHFPCKLLISKTTSVFPLL
jgi:hypothetical protein